MTQSSQSPDIIDCPECSFVYEADSVEDARNFAQKHREHTGHDVNCETDAGDSIEIKRYRLFCMECVEKWHFDSEEKAEIFKEEHFEHTDHEISTDVEPIGNNIPAPHSFKGVTQEYLRRVIEILEDVYDGPPSEEPLRNLLGGYIQTKELDEAIQELKMQGKAYEPDNGRIKIV